MCNVQWTSPLELHGIGQYAADAYYMFCRGDWRSIHPADKDLAKYRAFLEETNGEGMGLQHEPAPILAAPSAEAAAQQPQAARPPAHAMTSPAINKQTDGTATQ